MIGALVSAMVAVDVSVAVVVAVLSRDPAAMIAVVVIGAAALLLESRPQPVLRLPAAATVIGVLGVIGLATAALAWFGVRRGETWAYVTAVATPVLGLAVALPAHYPYGLATIGHLGLIYLAVIVFVVGAALALPSFWGSRTAERS